MTTTMTINEELLTEERAAGTDEHLLANARAAHELAASIGHLNPATWAPGRVYGQMRAHNRRLRRLAVFTGASAREPGDDLGYLTGGQIKDDIRAVNRFEAEWGGLLRKQRQEASQ